jgi:aminoglycoside 3-N-acetyltransferase
VPVADENGRRVWRDMEEFDTSDKGAHPNWPERFFSRLVDTYLAQTNNSGGNVGDAHCFLLDSRGLLDFALGVMQAVAADPRAAASLHAG